MKLITMNRSNFTLGFLFIVLLNIVYWAIIYARLPINSLLLIGDMAYLISDAHMDKFSYFRDNNYWGVSNGISNVLMLPNILVYQFFHHFCGLEGILLQISMFFTIGVITNLFAYYGFYKLYLKNLDREFSAGDLYVVLMITFFYMYTIYNITNMSNGISFSVTFISYGLIPLVFHMYQKIQNNQIPTYYLFTIPLIIFIFACQATYIIPLLFSLVVFSIATKKGIYLFNRKIFIIAILSFLLLSLFISTFIFETKYNTFLEVNSITASGGNVDSILDIFFNYYSWILYTYWVPKTLMSFSTIYVNTLFQITIISFYMTIFYLMVLKRDILKNSLPYISIFLISIFFAKSTNAPFGFIHDFFLNNIPLYSTVRSPDNKFGALATFALSMIVLNILKYHNKPTNYLVIFSIFVTYLATPFITQEVILGKNTFPNTGYTYFDYNKDYQDAISYINNDKKIGNVLILPKINGAIIQANKLFIGREIFGIQITKPIIYNSEYRGSKEAFNMLKIGLDGGNNEVFEKLNISYIVLRKDLFLENNKDIETYRNIIKSRKLGKLILTNNNLELYKINNNYCNERINTFGKYKDLEWNYINPTRYDIRISSVKDTIVLNFIESYSKYFNIYIQPFSRESFTNRSYLEGDELSFTTSRYMLKCDHQMKDFYNKWTIRKDDIVNTFDSSFYKLNNDGTIDIKLVIFYTPQLIGYIFSALSFLTFFILLLLSTIFIFKYRKPLL